MTASAAPRLRIENLRKGFDDLPVIRGITLDIVAGQTHALLGENGSGKSTLVKILAGYHDPDAGDLLIDGHRLERHEIRHRVTVIHQDLGLVGSMSVFDNIAIGLGYATRAWSPIRERALRRRIREAQASIGGALDPDARVDSLTAPERTFVAVTRAVMRLTSASVADSIFILDEPTSAATGPQAESLMRLMRDMADRGATVLFITHRIAEAMTADRVTVLRDGEIALHGAPGAVSEQDVIDAMLGRGLDAYYPDKLPRTLDAPVLLTAKGLAGDVLDGFDLELRAGEITGVTGIGGMGQDELPALICRARAARAGTIRIGDTRITSYSQAITSGIAYVPADRRRDGGWLEGSAAENVTLPSLRELTRSGFLSTRAERGFATGVMRRTGVRPMEPARHFGLFSGGNQQKLVIGKWLQRDPKILLLHEPTQGVDVGARRELLHLISAVAAAGNAVLVCSNDFEQLAEICQRIVIVYEGRAVAQLTDDEVTESAIARAAQLARSMASRSSTASFQKGTAP